MTDDEILIIRKRDLKSIVVSGTKGNTKDREVAETIAFLVEQKSQTLTPIEIITILASLGHCNAKGFGFEFEPVIDKIEKIRGEK